MKILIIGTGLSGATLARLLVEEGSNVSLIEKEGYAGGLCITRVNEDGLKYEPFGARTFHTSDAKTRQFVTRFDDFNGYTHRKGMIINGKLFPFPITMEAINGFEDKEQILKELEQRPKTIDKTNFETAAISIFGKTLYGYFIENYTRKMWGCDPRNLTADWAPKRLEVSEDNHDELFHNQWQGLPKNGYSFLLEKMIEGIPVRFNTRNFDSKLYDVVVSSAPIDQIMDFKYGKLQYRSLKFEYKRDESWERNDYGTINLPQHPKYIRKCNFNVLHKVESSHNWIQYQEPIAADNENVPMYPVNTKENEDIFDKYLRKICETNICPIGRLGLFKYLDMDKAVMHAFEMAPLVVKYQKLTPDERFNRIQEIVKKY